MVGNDNYAGQRFLYLPGSYGYGQNNDHNGPGGFFGQNIGNAKPGAWEATQSNPYAKWETAVKQNYGLDFNILNDHLSVSADYFIENVVIFLELRTICRVFWV